MMLKKKLKKLPDGPGVYLFKDAEGKVIYVGKASSLKKRLSSYFRGGQRPGPKQEVLKSHIEDFDYIVTGSEEEALLLEASLVKKIQPRYNVALKDDKRYPLLKVTVGEEFPRILIARRAKPDGSIYYGRYTSAKLLRQALAIMRRLFPLRTCRTMPKRPCLDYSLGQCLAPCIGKASKQKYRQIVKEVCLFLEGNRQELIKAWTERMKQASGARRYEEAARFRDQIQALSRVTTPRHSFRMEKGVRVPRRGRGTLRRWLEVEELQKVLGLAEPPIRIEAFDISNIFGSEAVGSMVSFYNGAPDKSNYKRFRIKGALGIDDYNMLREVVSRRYKRVLAEGISLPGLILIDGGKGHVSCAKEALSKLASSRKSGREREEALTKVPVIGISKRLEEIHLMGRKEAIRLSRSSRALQLIQRVRDEAHRFAIVYHHKLRRRLTTTSILDQIPGIGPKRKQLLLKNCTNFELKVYKAASQIPKGETRSYKWVAEKIGHPKAVRAVGQALKKNPLPGIIPCHRVIRSDGSLGGFSKGLAAKRRLLNEEKPKSSRECGL